MPYNDQRKQALVREHNSLMQRIRSLKEKGNELERRKKLGLSVDPEVRSGFSEGRVAPGAVSQFKSFLQEFLPPELMPGNVGGLNAVNWPFWETVQVDFGDDPVLTPGLSKSNTFRVTEEAGLLLLSVQRFERSYTEAGRLGPWQVIFTDRQATRQFNDTPIPIQNLGYRGRPTMFPTPMFLMPNAIFEVTVSTWVDSDDIEGNSVQLQGSGLHDFTFYGVRIRVEDYENVASTVYAK